MDCPAAKGLAGAPLAQFQALRQRYIAGLPTRWREIANAASPPGRNAALHRLAGSAASFGFEHLHHCAREAELASCKANDVQLPKLLALLETEVLRLTDAQ